MNNIKNKLEELVDYCLSLTPDQFEKKGLYYCTKIKDDEVGFWFSWTEWGDGFYIKLGGEDIYRSSDNDYIFFAPKINSKIKKIYENADSYFKILKQDIISNKISKILRK